MPSFAGTCSHKSIWRQIIGYSVGIGSKALTDASGHFVLEGLFVGRRYKLEESDNAGKKASQLTIVEPAKTGIVELGECQVTDR